MTTMLFLDDQPLDRLDVVLDPGHDAAHLIAIEERGGLALQMSEHGGA